MKQVFYIRVLVLTLGIFLVSCSSQKQSTPIISTQPTQNVVGTETATDFPATEPLPLISTPESIVAQTPASENVIGTVLNIKFPFEPSFPGYLVEIKSKPLSVDLMCILQQGNTTGDAVELNSSEMKKYGVCDTKSMTLDTRIDEEITVTVILGGHPIVNEVTKSPDRITDDKVEFEFEYSFE